MTPEEFTKEEANRVELARVLDTPILKLALSILKDELEPAPRGPADTNPVLAAARFQQVAGANHILKGLDRLTRLQVAPKRLEGRKLLPPDRRPEDDY